MRVRTFLTLLICLPALPSLLAAQLKVPSKVELFFSVFDSKGFPVTSLTSDNLQLFENDKPVPIRSLKFQPDTPVSIGILVDISRSMGPSNTSLALRLVKTLAEKLKSPDELFLMAFSEDAELVVDLISPEDYLEEALDHLGTGGTTYTGLAVDRALSKLREAHNPKRVVLMISTGKDRAGQATLEHIGRARLPIYAISLEGAGGIRGAYDSFGALSLRGSVLSIYAEKSGGQAYGVLDLEKGEMLLEGYCREWKNQFRLEYESPNLKPDGKYRNLQIKPVDPQLQVRHLPRYFVPLQSRRPVMEY